MDIDLLSKMVKELILDNDRVVLPGLGSFVAEIVPSTFSDRGYTINPPYRRLFFRSKPDEGEMLVRFYAESNNVEPELAERIIRDFVSELKEVLHTKKNVTFPGLGRLRATKENNVFFVADEELDIYPAGFGLEPISLKTNEEAPQEKSAAVEELEDIADEPIDLEIEDDFVPAGWADEGIPADGPEGSVSAAPEEQAPGDVEEEILQMEHIAVPEHVTEPEPEPESEPESEPLPASDPEPSAPEASEPVTPAQVKVPASAPAAVPSAAPQVEPWKKTLTVIGIVIACLVALLLIYMLVMRIFPDFLNGVLYSPEELEIINFK